MNTPADRATIFEKQLDELRLCSGNALAELGTGPRASRAELELESGSPTFFPLCNTHSHNRTLSAGARRMGLCKLKSHPDAMRWPGLARSKCRAPAGIRGGSNSAGIEPQISSLSARSHTHYRIILGIAVTVFTFKYSIALERENARRLAEVCEARRSRGELSGRLLEIQEEERKQLSRELHDEVGQTLTALRIEISRALEDVDVSEKHERLRRARDLANQTVATTRNLSALLRPPILDDLGLEAALQWQVELCRGLSPSSGQTTPRTATTQPNVLDRSSGMIDAPKGKPLLRAGTDVPGFV